MAGMDFKNVNFKALNKYLSPRAFDDLNIFLEKLPQHAGQTVLIAAGIAWATAAALGLFATIKAQDLNNLRAQLQDAKALKPIVPSIREVPVPKEKVDEFAKKMKEVYKDMEISSQDNTLTINSKRTSNYFMFREAVAQAQNGGAGWKLGLDNMCVGRECKQNVLSITLKINKIDIDKPQAQSVSYFPTSTSTSKKSP